MRVLLPTLGFLIGGSCFVMILRSYQSLNTIQLEIEQEVHQLPLDVQMEFTDAYEEEVDPQQQTHFSVGAAAAIVSQAIYSPSRKPNAKPLETALEKLAKLRQNPQLTPRNPIDKSLARTVGGVDVSSRELYAGKDLKGDSSTATVIGMATGYDLVVYQRFVGSLRKSGYKGHIILGVAPDVSEDVLEYFKYRQVTWHKLKMVNCTNVYKKDTNESKKKDKKKTPPLCAHPYTDIKTRWSRFPLQRDWLDQCPTCTGPVLIMDVRDSFFQQDPFGPGSPPVHGLFVMEEYSKQKTTHWLARVPLEQCKGIKLDEIMLCSGTTVGTRRAMMKYLQIMHAEMKLWANDPECRFGFHGDDQSIHNYLYYSGQLPFAKAWANRAGGIVNTVGVEGSNIQKAHVKRLQKKKGYTKNQARGTPFLDDSSAPGKWLGLEWNMTNEEGWFTEADGSMSRVIHQYDRFGKSIWDWLPKQDLVNDPMPSSTTT